MKNRNRPAAWLSALGMALAVAACGGGGGGGGGGGTALTSTPANARNGDYRMYAADARVYTLNLDFDTGAYRITGNGLDATGEFSLRNTAKGEYALDAGTAIPAPGSPRFHLVDNTLVGAFRLPSGTVPFIASRSFVTSLAEAAGTYHFLTRELDPAAPNDNSSIFDGELQAGGTFRFCNDFGVFSMAACPPASVVTAAVTVQGDEFRGDAGGGAVFPFRVLKLGSSRVFLRASPAAGTLRRFWVGVPAGTRFGTASDYEGQNTSAQWTFDFTLDAATYSANWLGGGSNFIRSGTASETLPGLLNIATPDVGNFFATRADSLLVLSSARSNPTVPGYFELAVKP